jgi:hypothetical protein
MKRQRGAAVLLLILTMIVMLTIVLAPRMTLWQARNASVGLGSQALIDAKAAILAYAANPGADAVAGRRLGQILLTPDLPVGAGNTFTGSSPAPSPIPNGVCATRTWTPGQALTDPTSPLVSPLSVRCFGRFPWLSLGLPGPVTSDDQDGEVPWIFMSANLVVGNACLPNFTPLMLSKTFSGGGCGSTVPFPWLNVVDYRGNLLSSEVAIVLILPGPSIANSQRRVSPADRAPAVYLDSLTVTAACPAPCVPGTYNNAAYTIANGAAWTFIDAPSSTALGPQPPYYTQPFQFNDRLIYITAGEYFEAMEQRARLAALNTLAQFRSTNGYLPYSGDNPSTPFTTSCALQSHIGLLPTAANCGGTLNYPTWYTSAGWGSYFIYAVDPGCVASAPAPRCTAPTLQLGGAATRYNAVLFSPGRAIVSAPYAASKGAAQAPISSGSLADFLDSARNVTGPPFDAAGTPPTANYNDRMYGIP